MGKSSTAPDRLLAAMRRREAIQLRLKGLTQRAIADEIGISHQHVCRIITESLEATRARTAEDIELLRELEGRRMDEVIQALWDARADPEVSGAIIRASARRAKLYGLDAPVRVAPQTEEAMPLHLENLSLDELREYERLLAKASEAAAEAIDVTPPKALPVHEVKEEDEGTG